MLDATLIPYAVGAYLAGTFGSQGVAANATGGSGVQHFPATAVTGDVRLPGTRRPSGCTKSSPSFG